MERWTKKAIELATRLAVLMECTPSVTEYIPSKTEVPPIAVNGLAKALPESVGVSSGRIAAMLKELEGDESLNLHNVVLAKNGKIISSSSRPGFDTKTPHLSHSMSKVLVSIAIGYLIEDGKLSLNDKLVDILPKYIPSDKRFSDITVHHLLSMTTGVKFSEVGVVTESEWTECFFEGALRFAPGEKFAYNSMNTYLLAVIAKAVGGIGVADIIKERLLLPLGIKDFFWEIGPEGVEKGGFGVYMSLESWAKIGSVFLSSGMYNGISVIPSRWIDTVTSAKVQTAEEKNGYDYGYQVWTAKDGRSYLFSGMLGQMVYMSRINNLVIAVNAGNDELFFSSNALKIIEKYFSEKLPDISADSYSHLSVSLKNVEGDFLRSREWIHPLKAKKGILHRIGLKFREPYPGEWEGLLGSFTLPMNNTSILPIFVRTMQNNFPASLEEIGFEREGRRIFLLCRDGGNDLKIELGFYKFAESIICVGGEKYRVRALGCVELEEDEIVFKIELVYPELPNSKRILIRRRGRDVISIDLSEAPGVGLVNYYLGEALSADPKIRFVLDMLESKLGRGYLSDKISGLFEKRISGVRRGSLDYSELIDREREKTPRPTSEERAVAALVLKLIGGSERGAAGFLGELFSSAIGRLRHNRE